MGAFTASFGARADLVAVGKLLSNRLGHRGPDAIGARSSGRAVVAHARLAIVDVARGQQPILGENERTLLVCDGEIYNHAALRHSLSRKHLFRSRCDSEVILHLFEEYGPACVERLDGMFAFFVTDGERLIAARDPFGIKPLYWGEDAEGGLWFASELKALADQCVTLRAVPPGAYLTQSRTLRYWFEPDWGRRPLSHAEVAPGELRRALEVAVVKRLMSDVPVGLLLSGGVNSSLIAALAREHLERLDTFAVGLKESRELAAARYVANQLGARHHERVYSVKDITRHLGHVIYHLESYDPALVRAAFRLYFAAALASEQVKVVLTGLGGNELLGSHPRLRTCADPALFQQESVRMLLGLHARGLQYIDRMTMAHGLEARVPFLDVQFAERAMIIDPKVKRAAAGPIENRFLSQVASSLVVPRARAESELEEACPLDFVLTQLGEILVSDRDMASAAKRFPGDPPRTKEALLYRMTFLDFFPSAAMQRTVARSLGVVRPASS